MPAREFKDGRGREWRVWDVRPDDLNARTKDEDFLAQLYYTGWIVFEMKAGSDKRRLYPIPKGWNELPDAELEVLLQKAEVVPPRKLRTEKRATGNAAVKAIDAAAEFAEKAVESPEEVRDVPREETPDVTDLSVLRTFRYPGGRIWAVCVVPHREGGGPPILQFAAGARHINLEEWPKDWADYPDEELVNLLRRAAPRAKSGRSASETHKRRWDDAASA
jgi:hypothetical protein